MANPRSLVFALYSHWPVVEWLVQRTREIPAFESEQVLALISKVDPGMPRDARENVLRALINTEILRVLPRDELLQLNPLVLEFVRGLNREHELGLSAVLQARVQGIRDATERLNEAIEGNDLDLLRQCAVQLIELFRQIAQQLDQDRHAILEIAEKAKSTEAHVPAERRYRQVLQAYDDYIEPMAEMMDSGPSGSFYRLLEDAERQIDYCQEKLAVQGALYTLRMLVRQAGFQVKELRRLGREVLKQCSDTLLPLREELRRHNSLSAAVSQLLGQVRKRGLSRTFRQPDFPVWRAERPRRVTVGDEVLTIMAEALAYEPVSQAFPDEAPAESATELQFVDGVELRERLAASGPVPSLLDWIRTNYAYLDDATVLRLYHELVRELEWEFQQDDQKLSTDLNRLRVTHYPHGIPAR
ncbi:hypothetical protein [Pseudomonas sp. PS02288]|uniref:hypothetical protein n=1 Tax=Pseudomonas sp. PS02288 TaxID=2991443 RepID=UPI00249B6681|nr:hypothetical protein [Pseudomonas sp. PS02288]